MPGASAVIRGEEDVVTTKERVRPFLACDCPGRGLPPFVLYAILFAVSGGSAGANGNGLGVFAFSLRVQWHDKAMPS